MQYLEIICIEGQGHIFTFNLIFFCNSVPTEGSCIH